MIARPLFLFPRVTTSAILAMAILATSWAMAAPGDLDTSFGTSGKVTTDIASSSSDGAVDVAVQPDGKVVVAGFTDSGSNRNFCVVRYDFDGDLDPTFGTSGKVTTDIAGMHDFPQALALQSDGKIVVAGYSNTATFPDFSVVRYTANGVLDTTFNSTGIVTTDFGIDDRAYDVAIQGNGDIVVIGASASGGNSDFAVAQYTSSGALDTAFDTDGKQTVDIAASYDFAYGVALQQDYKIVLVGSAGTGVGTNFGLTRLNANGTVDTAFGTSGRVVTDFFGDEDAANAAVVQPGGKILVAGHARNGSHDDFALAQYDSNGSPDLLFNLVGRVTHDFSGTNDRARALVIQDQGIAVVAGYANNGMHNEFALARIKTDDGSLDTGFGNSGTTTTDFSGNASSASGLDYSPSRGFVAAGGTNGDFAVARYRAQTYRPNLGLQKKRGSSYSNSLFLRTSRGHSVQAYLRIGNSGTADDAFRIKGSKPNRYFDISYSAGGNITARIERGTYVTPNLPAGDVRTVSLKIRPEIRYLKSRSRSGRVQWRKKNLKIPYNAYSLAEQGVRDRAKLKVLHDK